MKTFHGRGAALALLGGLPAVAVAVALISSGSFEASAWSTPMRWTAATALVGWWLALAVTLRAHIVRPLRTLSNLLAGLREGDYSARARAAGLYGPRDPLGEALREANALADILVEQRLGAMDATMLLRKVMEEIDVAVIAFDEGGALRLANGGAQRLLGEPVERLRGQTAAELGLQACLSGPTPRLLEPGFAGGAAGRFELRRAAFRQRGRPFQLLVLSDLSRALHAEEREAWQRLVRVLSHEINNSLAPIHSIAGSLQARLTTSERGSDWEADLRSGLGVIGSRAQALSRFMAAHARLARLPPPSPATLDVGAWVRRVAALETRVEVRVEPGPSIEIEADGDQLDQLLINLVTNAVDAVEASGTVAIGWRVDAGAVEVRVEDDGPGLSDTANLFVPFYSTKPDGSGIGLALARQIAEAHEGGVTLQNRDDGPGCVARVTLPVG